jgi:hypothetical protein
MFNLVLFNDRMVLVRGVKVLCASKLVYGNEIALIGCSAELCLTPRRILELARSLNSAK